MAVFDKKQLVRIRFTEEQRSELAEILGATPDGIEFTVGELEDHVVPITLGRSEHLEGLWIFLGLSDDE